MKIKSKLWFPSTKVKFADSNGKTPKLSIVGYTGGLMEAEGLPHPVIINLKGFRFAHESIPILFDHNSNSRLGYTTKQMIKANKVLFRGMGSGTSEEAKGVLEDMRNGFPFQASLGGDVMLVKLVPEEFSKEINVNGIRLRGTKDGPFFIAEEFVADEISVLTFGADSNTTSRIAARAVRPKNLEVKLMRVKTKKPATSRRRKPVKASKKAGEVMKVRREKMVKEENRCDNIRKIARTFSKRKFAPLSEKDKFKDLKALKLKALKDGWSSQRFELEAHRRCRPNVSDMGVIRGGDKGTAKDSPLRAAVFLHLNGKTDEKFLAKHFKEETLNMAEEREYRSISLHRLIDQSLHMAGIPYRGNRRDSEYLKCASQAERRLRAAGQSTHSVTNILEDAMHKMMLAAWEAQAVTWPQITRERPLNDFRPHNLYRLDNEGSYKLVGEDGELKHARLTDAKYSLQADTYGVMISLSRQKMIDDDLGALTEMPPILGRMASIRVEELVYVTLLSNPGSFFSAGNNNIVDLVLNIAALTAAEEVFMNQVDVNGKPILIMPRILLTGTALSVTANELFDETKVRLGGADASAGRQFVSNPHVGKFRPLVSPYINNTRITDQDGQALTGQSDTQWYLLADPSERAFMNVGFVNGNRTPTIEAQESDFSTLGMQWRSYHDFGVGMHEHEAALFSDGVP